METKISQDHHISAANPKAGLCASEHLVLLRVLDAFHRQFSSIGGPWINFVPDPAYPVTLQNPQLVRVSHTYLCELKKITEVHCRHSENSAWEPPHLLLMSTAIKFPQVPCVVNGKNWPRSTLATLNDFATPSQKTLSLLLMKKRVQTTHSGVGVDIFGQKNPTYYFEISKSKAILKRSSNPNTHQKNVFYFFFFV